MMNSFGRLSYLIALSVFFVVGCGTDSNSDNNGQGGNGQVDDGQVTVTMQLSSSTASIGQRSSAGKQTVEMLTEVKLLVEEIEFENVADDLHDFEVNDLIVNLPVDGSEVEIVTDEVPPGIYDEFNMEVDYHDDTTVDDPDFINEADDDDGYSIVVRGIYDGEEFLFRSDEDFDIDLDFNPPLEVTESSSPSVTIMVDPSGWFKDASGNDLDPRNPANFDRIDENIENSFDIDEDNDDDDDD